MAMIPFDPETRRWLAVTTATGAIIASLWQLVPLAMGGIFSFRGIQGGAAPGGAAGGDLGGSYPNPTVLKIGNVTTGVLPVANGGTGSATNTGSTAYVALQNGTPGTAQVGSVNVLGSGATSAAAGAGTIISGSLAPTGGITTTALATPVNGTFSTACTGGTLNDATTFFYRVTATNAAGETVGSTETSQATGACSGANTSVVTVTWAAIAGATGYNVYGRTTGAETKITASIGTTALSYIDTGSALSGALPPSNTSGNVTLANGLTVTTGGGSWTGGVNGISILTSGGNRLQLATSTGYTQILATAATARAGLANQTTRNIIRNSSVAPVDCAGGAINATVTQMLDGSIFTCATAQTLTFPTWQGASGIVQGLPGAPAIGDWIGPIVVASTASATFTVAAGTGGTIVGNTTVANGSTDYWCRLTNVTASSEAATCYGGGGNGGGYEGHSGAYNSANLASATAFGEFTIANASTLLGDSKMTHDIAGTGTGTFVVKLCSDGTTCGGGNVYLTCTAGANCATAAAGRRDACTVTKSAVPAATTLTWSVTTACGTSDPGTNLDAHWTTP